jgi:hypothetical protein
VNQLDIRVAKIFRHGDKSTVVGVDTYNAVNSGAVLAYNSAFVPGGTWLQPLSIMAPRLIRMTLQTEF